MSFYYETFARGDIEFSTKIQPELSDGNYICLPCRGGAERSEAEGF